MHIPAANVYVLHGINYMGSVKQGGLYLTPDRDVLEDLSRTFGAPVEKALKKLRIPRFRKLNGTTVVLSVALANIVYGHWICELIPRILMLHKAGYSPDKVDHYILNHNGEPHQLQTLALLGIPEDKVILDSSKKNFQCEKLITMSLFFGFYSSPEKEYILMSYPQFASPLLPEIDLSETDSSEWPKRIYLTRRFCKHRRIINEEDLLSLIKEYGFTEIVPEKLSFRDQRILFSQVETVISPHGSTLANIVFCRAGANVIQLHSPRYVNTVYWNIAQARKLSFFPLMGINDIEIIDEDDLTPKWENNRADITVDLEALRSLLDALQ